MNNTFAETLRRIRTEQDFSQQALAEKLCVGRFTIAGWETGRRLPDATLIKRLSECLNVDIALLMNAAGMDDENLNVIMLDDERIILKGGIPILEEVLPGTAITGFTKPSEALAFARNNRIFLAFLDINSYLRKNFTAIAKAGTIPFTEELERTRAYLAVEQVRFEGNLFVEFNTPHTNFRLPPLTLQPIVENAVKHGVDPELEPLYISIHTRETADGSEIIVEDNGLGMEDDGIGTSIDSDHPTAGTHTALANIRERLELICKGTLEIKSRDGGGMVVTISVPGK